jgi:Secretion system C-terminal sorting domain
VNLTTTQDVLFKGVQSAVVTVLSDTVVTAVVPEGATTGPVQVVLTTGSRSGRKSIFTVLPSAPLAKTSEQQDSKAGSSQMNPLSLAAYPNPFNRQVTLHFSLPTSQPVEVKVYDLLGRVVKVLYRGQVQAHQTYQVEWQPKAQQAAGLYLLQIQSPQQESRLKVLLNR